MRARRNGERFDRVVVATGRFQSPTIPEVPGLDRFAGSVGVTPPTTIGSPHRIAASVCSSPAAR